MSVLPVSFFTRVSRTDLPLTATLIAESYESADCASFSVATWIVAHIGRNLNVYDRGSLDGCLVRVMRLHRDRRAIGNRLTRLDVLDVRNRLSWIDHLRLNWLLINLPFRRRLIEHWGLGNDKLFVFAKVASHSRVSDNWRF